MDVIANKKVLPKISHEEKTSDDEWNNLSSQKSFKCNQKTLIT